MTNLVIIGLSSGGFAALLSARKFDPKAQITIIDQKPFDLLHRCGLPYALEGTLPLKDLKHDINVNKSNVKIVKGKATQINSAEKKVLVDNSMEVKFDSLIIATGASPLIPPIEGVKELLGKTVFTVYTYNDTESLDKKTIKEKKAIVVGAGPIGLEVAVALKKRGLEVTVIEAAAHLLPKSLDTDMVVDIEKYLKEIGIKFLFGKTVEKITETQVFFNKGKIDCEVVVLSVGVKPNVEIALSAGAQTGQRGVKVNEFLETTQKGIFAVGDVIEVPNLINNIPMTVGLANAAYQQGLLAGPNALGAKKKYFGTTLTFVTVLGELQVASTGFNKEFAIKQGIGVVEGTARGKNKYGWFPGAKSLLVKILADKKTRKVIGAQAIGHDAYMRINVVSTAIKAGLTIDEIADIELAYCPPISEAHDILLLAAQLALRKFDRLKQ